MNYNRIIAVILTLVITISTAVNVNASDNSITINNENVDAYKAANLVNGQLAFYFSGANGQVKIAGDAVERLYYDSQVQNYVFTCNGLEVCANKNNFMDFKLASIVFNISSDYAFEATFYYNDSTNKKLKEGLVDNLYTLPQNAKTTGTAVAIFTLADGQIKNDVKKQYSANGLVFKTNYLGSFKIESFSFNDLTNPAAWYYEYVNTLGAYGILSGKGEGRFDPDKNVTRAELVTMLIQATAHIISYRTDPSLSFSDVNGQWFHDYVMQCAALGIVMGKGEGRFAPMANATRQEVAIIIQKVIEICASYNGEALPAPIYSAPDIFLKSKYKDGALTAVWAQSAAAFVTQLGIMRGNDKGEFKGGANITRAECATIFYHLFHSLK